MPAQLWLLRHGDAEPHGTRPDADRALTAAGRAQATNAGLAMRRLRLSFEAVLTSPRLRALDTARLACTELRCEPVVHEPLHAGFDRSAAEELLAGMAGRGRILVVGHEPDFSQLVHDFTGARIDLKKGGIAGLRTQRSGATLISLLRPREIELIAHV